jgi:excisionase family DNA binding protein
MDTLLSVRQVAFILKVHPLTIRRYLTQGKLKAVKVGGNVRIKEKDLQEFHRDLAMAPRQQSIILNAKKRLQEKPFTPDDPFLRLKGLGASLHSYE